MLMLENCIYNDKYVHEFLTSLAGKINNWASLSTSLMSLDATISTLIVILEFYR